MSEDLQKLTCKASHHCPEIRRGEPHCKPPLHKSHKSGDAMQIEVSGSPLTLGFALLGVMPGVHMWSL